PRAFDTALADLYGGHPYAWPALGRAESVARLTRDALLERYAAAYRAGRMVLAVAGGVPRQRVIAAAERLFKRAPGAAAAAVLAEVDRLRRDRVEEREVARAKAWLLGNLAMDRRTSARHAWYLAFFELVGGGWDWPERYARAVETVTVADLARVAER